MATANERLLEHVRADKPLSGIFGDDLLEKAYRHLVRTRNDELVAYLAKPAVVEDFLGALVSEDALTAAIARNITEGSEALAIILNNFEPVAAVIVEPQHLDTLFSYLNSDALQSRRAYFFLRATSFLFQNRMVEMFAYINDHHEVVENLVRHIKSQHVVQLVLNMLAVERQLKEISGPAVSWSENTRLFPLMVESLRSDPEANLESVQKFFVDVTSAYPFDSAFIKNIVLSGGGLLLRTIQSLLGSPSTADAAVRMLDSVVFPIVVKNIDDGEFYEEVVGFLNEGKDGYKELLEHRSLQSALAGAKFTSACVRHGMHFLVDEIAGTFVGLLFRFKWANVIHDVVASTIIYSLVHLDHEFCDLLFERADLIANLCDGLTDTLPAGNRGHLLLIANALFNSADETVQERLRNSEKWQEFDAKLRELNLLHRSFREVEADREAAGHAEPEPPKAQTVAVQIPEIASKKLEIVEYKEGEGSTSSATLTVPTAPPPNEGENIEESSESDEVLDDSGNNSVQDEPSGEVQQGTQGAEVVAESSTEEQKEESEDKKEQSPQSEKEEGKDSGTAESDVSGAGDTLPKA